MAKFQIALMLILIACVAFMSCERVQHAILGEAPMDDEGETPPAAEGETPPAEGETPPAEGETPPPESNTNGNGGNQ